MFPFQLCCAFEQMLAKTIHKARLIQFFSIITWTSDGQIMARSQGEKICLLYFVQTDPLKHLDL